MSEITLNTVTESYPWDIKVSPRSEFGAYPHSFNISGLRFDFGFMKNISHDWLFLVNSSLIIVKIIIRKPLTQIDTSIVKLRKLEVDLISGGVAKLKTELTPVAVEVCTTYNGIKQPYTEYSSKWAPKELWDDSIDQFRVTFEISKHTNVVQKIAKPIHTQVEVPLANPTLNSKKFLFSSYLSDVSVACDRTEFKAHRLILASESQVFDKMFRADKAEAKSVRVEITEFKPEVVEQLLKYMYTKEYPAELEVAEMIVQLFSIAHKYLINGLKDFCETLLLKNVTVDNALEVCELAHLYTVDNLKRHAFEVIKRNKKELCKNTNVFKEIVNKFPETAFEIFGSFD